jgi:hypothetical protein
MENKQFVQGLSGKQVEIPVTKQKVRKNGKKIYPSEESTKAIACRVPIKDYVVFLKEAVEMNCSISDWLLMKVYEDVACGIVDSSQPPTFANGGVAEPYIHLEYDKVVDYLIEKGYDKHDAKAWARSFGLDGEDEKFYYWRDWVDMEEKNLENYQALMNSYEKMRVPNLTDIKVRIDKLLKEKKDLTAESRKLHIKRISEALRILEGG